MTKTSSSIFKSLDLPGLHMLALCLLQVVLKVVIFFFFFRLSSLSIDSAQPGNGSTDNPALGVEICQCPEQYSGLSCQVGGTGERQP
jgi:hypothetical protein